MQNNFLYFYCFVIENGYLGRSPTLYYIDPSLFFVYKPKNDCGHEIRGWNIKEKKKLLDWAPGTACQNSSYPPLL